jgi:tRNA nucleotidyltransferase (CCA-adding enzyme)
MGGQLPASLWQRLHALPALQPVLAAVQAEGAPTAAVVGGAVRDLLLEQTPTDIDVVTEGSAEALAARLGTTVRSHQRFATVTVQTEHGRVDVAQARSERYAHPGALPEVEAAKIAVDLARRDFTVNALAIILNGTAAGELQAAPGALDDLDRRQLAVLHERSFSDDPTRLLRLARYRARLGFTVAPETRRLALKAIADGTLETVSGARIGNELRLLCREREPQAALRALGELGIDRALDPDFGLDAEDATFACARELLPADGRLDLLALAAAGRHVPEARLWSLLARLDYSAPDRERAVAAATGAQALAQVLQAAELASQIGAAVAGAELEEIALAGALAAPRGREHARRWLQELRHLRLTIDGHDLLAAGVAPGPAIGLGLAAARGALLDGTAQTHPAQLQRALAAIAESGQGSQ